MDEKIEIPVSRTKAIIMLLSSLVFIGIGVKFLMISVPGRNPIFEKSLGIITILVFTFFAVTIIFNLFSKRIGLTIDERGITENSTRYSIGLIPWEDIVSIEKHRVMSTKFILLKLRNPEDYIMKGKNKMTIRMLKSNYKMIGTPVSLTSKTLKCNFSELEERVQAAFDKYKFGLD